jgi:hypothetical protein
MYFDYPKYRTIEEDFIMQGGFLNGALTLQFVEWEKFDVGSKLQPGGGFLRPTFFVILKNSHQDLSNEGSNL